MVMGMRSLPTNIHLFPLSSPILSCWSASKVSSAYISSSTFDAHDYVVV